MDEKWVLLWSESQCAFHVEPLASMFKTNLGAFRASRSMDYIPLHIGSNDECTAMADHLRPILRHHQDVRALTQDTIDKAAL